MSGIALKYNKLKQGMLSGSISKGMFQKGYQLCAQSISSIKKKH